MLRPTLALALAASLLTPALAQPDSPPLRGPAVDNGSQEGRGRFAEGRQNGQPQRPIPLQTVMRLINALDSEDLADDLQLTDDQRAQIDPIMASYTQAVSDYYTEHKDDMVSLLREAGIERAANRLEKAETIDAQAVDRAFEQMRGLYRDIERPARPAPEGEMQDERPVPTEDQRAALRRLGEIRREAPGSQYQAELMEVLTPAQRRYVEERIANLTSGRRTDRAPGEPMLEDNMMAPGQPPAGPLAGGVIKSERLGRLLADLSVEEQDMLADQIERFRERRGPRQGGQPKPPPSSNDINVPPPDDDPQ